MRGLAAAALSVCALLALMLAPPATAQTESRVTLEVARFTGVLEPTEDFRARIRVRNHTRADVDDLRVVVTLHRAARSRFDYQQAVDEGEVGRVLDASSVALDPVPPGGTRTIDLERTAAELGFTGRAPGYGVYPLRVAVTDEGEVVDEVVTSVVLTPTEVEAPVRVGVVWPLDAPPALRPDDDVVVRRLAPQLAATGRLDDLVEAAAAHPTVPLTLAPSGLLLEQVAALAAVDDLAGRQAATFLERVRDVAQRPNADLLALAYGPADLVALTRGGLGTEAARHITVGRVTVENLTGARPERGLLWPPDGLNPATLAEALSAGVEAVILGEGYLEIPADRSLQFSPGPVRRLRTAAGASVSALVPDPWLEETLQRRGAPHGAAVAAQRIVAETATVYFERPFADETRGLLLAPPQVWVPAPGVADALLDGFADAPWLRLERASALPGAVASDGTVALDYPEEARARELSQAYVEELEDARGVLGSLATVLPPDSDLPARFDRLLLAAASVGYREPLRTPEGRALVGAVTRGVAELYDAVAVVESVPVTLTSIEGQVPVTLRSDAPVPLEVQVRLVSTRYRFAGDGTQRVTLAPGEVTTLAFTAEALTPGGTYPIAVVVEDGNGTIELAQGTVVVRSTAYSIAALVLTGGAAVFLLVWWVRDARRRRRAAAAEAAAERERGARALTASQTRASGGM
jgi:hypothetical protein